MSFPDTRSLQINLVNYLATIHAIGWIEAGIFARREPLVTTCRAEKWLELVGDFAEETYAGFAGELLGCAAAARLVATAMGGNLPIYNYIRIY